jgi:amino acid permease
MPPSLRDYLGSGATIIANTIGAGLLSLPYTVQRAGLSAGVAGLAATGLMNLVGALLLARCTATSGAATFKDVLDATLGPRLVTFLCVVLSIYTLGSCASYVVVIADVLEELFKGRAGAEFLASPTAALPAVAAFVLFPLSLLRDLSSLRVTSTLSLVCIVYTSLLVVGSAFSGPLAPREYIVVEKSGPGVFVGLPISLVAFTMHYNVPSAFARGGRATPPSLRQPCPPTPLARARATHAPRRVFS